VNDKFGKFTVVAYFKVLTQLLRGHTPRLQVISNPCSPESEASVLHTHSQMSVL